MINVGLVGCGAIGGVIAEAIVGQFSGSFNLAHVCDLDEEKAKILADKFKTAPVISDLDKMIDSSDLIIEAASPSASYSVAKKAVLKGKDVLVLSSGGLLDKPDLFLLAHEKKARIYIPSGAICGLDGVKAARMAGIKSIVLTTKKPPRGLKGAPYIIENNIDIDSIKEETVVFEGSAEEAVKGFPKNVNVSATLSLCGIGAKETRVRIITSPHFTSNTHELEIRGDSGTIKTVTENVPMPTNPKTSFMAALSALAVLRSIATDSYIGT
ncbi:MAG: aspartate dehydrogenase [Candidatus Omnitrophica bacterium]|nr:aspartate dehydrogenase [Candidatus Omnitrophota bacterium]